jgi:hypothetical protein
MLSSTKLKGAAAIGGVAAIVALTAAPALAVPTGNEAITVPVSVPKGTLLGTTPYAVPEDSSGNPILSDVVIQGTGYQPGFSVYFTICDGKNPSNPGYSIASDCDSLAATGSFPVGAQGVGPGNIKYTSTELIGTLGVFRGVSPSDTFNCLAPNDDPNGTTVNDPGPNAASIDPTVPSYGSTLPLSSAGGSSSPCTIRIGYSPVNLDTSSDKFIPYVLSQGPATATPEAPLSILLPVGGVVLFAAAGAVLYRKRRSVSAAA